MLSPEGCPGRGDALDLPGDSAGLASSAFLSGSPCSWPAGLRMSLRTQTDRQQARTQPLCGSMTVLDRVQPRQRKPRSLEGQVGCKGLLAESWEGPQSFSGQGPFHDPQPGRAPGALKTRAHPGTGAAFAGRQPGRESGPAVQTWARTQVKP